jgi:hypothetical protein
MCFKEKKSQREFKHKLKFAMLEELGLKMPKSEEDIA